MSATLGHLVARFFGSLLPRRVRDADRTWARTLLTPAEQRVWDRLGRVDAVESLRVARRAERLLAATDDAEDPRWLAAALAHDVGKRESGLGTYRRAIATLLGRWASPDAPHHWSEARGTLRKAGLYLRHAELGATSLRVAGARPEVAEWAEIHHAPARWADASIPLAVCRALATADGERVEIPETEVPETGVGD